MRLGLECWLVKRIYPFVFLLASVGVKYKWKSNSLHQTKDHSLSDDG